MLLCTNNQLECAGLEVKIDSLESCECAPGFEVFDFAGFFCWAVNF